MKWEQNRVRKAAERDAAEVEDCTFVPRRNPGNDKKALPEDYKPIYERVDEVRGGLGCSFFFILKREA